MKILSSINIYLVPFFLDKKIIICFRQTIKEIVNKKETVQKKTDRRKRVSRVERLKKRIVAWRSKARKKYVKIRNSTVHIHTRVLIFFIQLITLVNKRDLWFLSIIVVNSSLAFLDLTAYGFFVYQEIGLFKCDKEFKWFSFSLAIAVIYTIKVLNQLKLL